MLRRANTGTAYGWGAVCYPPRPRACRVAERTPDHHTGDRTLALLLQYHSGAWLEHARRRRSAHRARDAGAVRCARSVCAATTPGLRKAGQGCATALHRAPILQPTPALSLYPCIPWVESDFDTILYCMYVLSVLSHDLRAQHQAQTREQQWHTGGSWTCQ